MFRVVEKVKEGIVKERGKRERKGRRRMIEKTPRPETLGDEMKS